MSSSISDSPSTESVALAREILLDTKERYKKNGDSEDASPLFLFLYADFCPWAERVWIALLERGLAFDEILCCYLVGPEKDRGTKLLYSMGFRTVPTVVLGVHNNGDDLQPTATALGKSSSLLAEYVDDLASAEASSSCSSDSLKPTDPAMLFHMRYFMEAHGSFCDNFYVYLQNQDRSRDDALAAKFEELLRGIEANLGRFPDGPYLCGKQFTLADLHVFGFVERALLVIPRYKAESWKIDPLQQGKTSNGDDGFPNLRRWYEAVTSRPSLRVVRGDRSEYSRDVMVFEATTREDYLIEVYEPYANNEVRLAKDLHAAGSRPGYNAYKAAKQALKL